MMRALRDAGIRRMVLVTGDRADIAETVGRIVGVDAVCADRDPSEKLAIVRAEQHTAPTIMVGDGVNDAPRWPPPVSAWPWPPAASPPPPKPPTSCSPPIASTASPTRSSSPAAPSHRPPRRRHRHGPVRSRR